jgi:hypothetical protein
MLLRTLLPWRCDLQLWRPPPPRRGGFAYYRVDLASNLAHLREANECNIHSLNGICSPITGVTPLAEDYILRGGLLARGLRQRQREFCLCADSVDLEPLIVERISSRVRGMSEGPPELLPEAGGACLAINRCLMQLKQSFAT